MVRWAPVLIHNPTTPSGSTPAASLFTCPANAVELWQQICPNAAKLQSQFPQRGGAANRYCLCPQAHFSCARGLCFWVGSQRL